MFLEYSRWQQESEASVSNSVSTPYRSGFLAPLGPGEFASRWLVPGSPASASNARLATAPSSVGRLGTAPTGLGEGRLGTAPASGGGGLGTAPAGSSFAALGAIEPQVSDERLGIALAGRSSDSLGLTESPSAVPLPPRRSVRGRGGGAATAETPGSAARGWAAQLPRGSLFAPPNTALQSTWSLTGLFSEEEQDELDEDERLEFSEALRSLDPMHSWVCRGDLSGALAAHASLAEVAAREQRRHHREAGDAHRQAAAEWRDRGRRRHAEAAAHVDGGSGSDGEQGSGIGGGGRKGFNAAISRAMKMQATFTDGSIPEFETNGEGVANKNVRVQDMISNLRAQFINKGNSSSRGTSEMSQYKGQIKGAIQAMQKLVTNKTSNAEKVRRAIEERLEMRRTHAKKAAKVKRARSKHVAGMPSAELNALRGAFDLYADRDNLPAEDLIRCLMEVGIAGKTRHERWSVERLCLKLYEGLVKEREVPGVKCDTADSPEADSSDPPFESAESAGLVEAGVQEDPSAAAVAGAPQSAKTLRKKSKTGTQKIPELKRPSAFEPRLGFDEAKEKDLPVIAQALAQVVAQQQAGTIFPNSKFNSISGGIRKKKSLNLPISFAEFNVEIVPAVREQLYIIRQEEHFGDFLHVLDKKGNDDIYLHPSELVELAAARNLDLEIAKATLAEAASKGSEEKESGRDDTKNDSKDGEPKLDVYNVHDILMQVEELTERKRHISAQEIRAKVGLEEEVFWQYRHEISKLYRTFEKYDDDEDQNLTHTEAKLLLKHLGFQPYRKGTEAQYVQRILEESDEDGNGLVDFLEFLGLMNRIRGTQLERRRPGLLKKYKLNKSFGAEEKSRKLEERCVDMQLNDVVEILNSIGVKLPEGSEGLVKQVADEVGSDLAALYFCELEDITQRVVERLQSDATQFILEMVEVLGLSTNVFAEYQYAFDQCARESCGGVSFKAVKKALELRMGREVNPVLVEDLYFEIRSHPEKTISIEDFFRLLHLAASPKHMFTKELLFTLHEVPPKKLREILRIFRVAEDFILKISFEDLVEHVANYLEVGLNADLREELSDRVTNVRQLVAYATKKANSSQAAAGGVATTGGTAGGGGMAGRGGRGFM